jgi:hypothetical protein
LIYASLYPDKEQISFVAGGLNVRKIHILFICVSLLYFAFFYASLCAANGEKATILKLYSAVNSAASRKVVCIHIGTAQCDGDFDYCMKPIEGSNGKIAYALQICFNQKMNCDSNCSSEYSECRDGDTPLQECYEEYVRCSNNCEKSGVKCQTDAISAHYEPPDLFRCATYRDICVKSVVERCSK